jgi:TonB family protein
MNFAGNHEPLIAFLLVWTAKATVLLGVAWIVSFALRRYSAAMRHRVWAIAIVGSLALPVVALAIPAWHLISAAPVAPTVASQVAIVMNSTPVAPLPPPPIRSFDIDTLIGAALLLWALGMALIGLRLCAGLARLARISAYSKTAPESARATLEELRRSLGVRRNVRLLESASATTMPMTWGVFRPTIVLPCGAAEWDDERRRIVLSHELAHVRRDDWLLQICAEALRACFWFHPLTWVAANGLRQESERACDDSVLNSGVAAPEYAGQLLALAKSLKTPDWRFSLALAVARPSNLERRFAAMLDSTLRRNPLSRKMSFVVFTTGVLVMLPLAALTLSAEATPETPQISSAIPSAPVAEGTDKSGGAAVAGKLTDQKGLPIQGVNVTLVGGEISDGTATGPSGEFLFSDLTPGVYTVHIGRGFGIMQSRSIEVHLASRASRAKINLTLRGSTSSSASAAAHAGTDSSERARAQNAASDPLGRISGAVGDPSGARVPRANLTLKDVATGAEQQITANPAGEFDIANIIPDNYELSIEQPGFQTYKQTIQVLAGEQLQLPELLLRIGAVTQTVVVSASGSGPATANSSTAPSAMVQVQACPATLQTAQLPYKNPVQPGPPPNRIRIGGNVEQARLVQQTMPIYPAAARTAGMQGTVVLNAIIGKDGTLLSTCVGSGPALLAQSALDAVSQWRYSPALLNGEPVEVMTEIDAVFSLRN